MSFDKFFDLLIMVYVTVLHILQRVSIVHALVTKIIQEAQQRGLIVGMESLSHVTKVSSATTAGSPNQTSPRTHRARRKTIDDDDDLDVGNIDTTSIESNQWAAAQGSAADALKGSIFEALVTDSANVLGSACDLAHVRCAKLIGVRSDQNSMLNPTDFYRLFGATWEFVNGAESITGRVCFGLKGTIMSQVRDNFLLSSQCFCLL